MVIDMVAGIRQICGTSSRIAHRRSRRRQRPSIARVFFLAICIILCNLSRTSVQTTFGNCTYEGSFGASSAAVLRSSDIANTVGSVSWGVSIDTSLLSIDEYIKALGKAHAPAIINIYFDTAHLGGLNEPLNCHVAATKAAGAILMLTIEPWEGLKTVDSTKVAQIGQLCRSINDAGVPLFIRFAHEMNGDWYPWGASPDEFKNAYTAIAKAIKKNAKNTLLVWAPNTGVGYPYNGAGKYLPANAQDSRFKQMDTNDDGRLDNSDDPFAPYYPGDDVVDWIGISLYSKRDNTKPDRDANNVNDRVSLRTYISNPSADPNFDIYTKYAVEKKKPFMIAETAAAYYPDFPEGDGEVAIKRAWWEQLWSDETTKAYPLLKAVVWFEYNKKAETGETRDYTITRNNKIRDAFLSDVAKTDAVAFLDSSKRQLTGGNGGCACTPPGDANGNSIPDKDAAVTTGVDRMVIALGLATTVMSFWFVVGG